MPCSQNDRERGGATAVCKGCINRRRTPLIKQRRHSERSVASEES